jgi:phosphatidylglycerophosphate synthase
MDLPVSKGGKLKTALQMLGITAILAAPVFQCMQAAVIGSGLIWLAALVALASAVSYTRASLRTVCA